MVSPHTRAMGRYFLAGEQMKPLIDQIWVLSFTKLLWRFPPDWIILLILLFFQTQFPIFQKFDFTQGDTSQGWETNVFRARSKKLNFRRLSSFIENGLIFLSAACGENNTQITQKIGSSWIIPHLLSETRCGTNKIPYAAAQVTSREKIGQASEQIVWDFIY